MTMTAASLVERWKIAFGTPDTPEGVTIQNETFEKFANGVIEEIQTNAVVTIPVGVPVATTGTAAAQTGATTAPAVGTIA